MLDLLKKTAIQFSVSSLLVCSSAAHCSEAISSQSTNAWHYSIAPYVWTSSINGDLQAQGHSERFNITFNQILKHLSFAFQGHFEAGRNAWTLMLDPTYMNLSDDSELDSINLKTRSKTFLVDAGVFYRIFSMPIADDRFLAVEALGAVRHLGIHNIIDAGNLRFSSTARMNTPIFGGRLKADLTPDAYFWLRGDYGGFHVDHVNQTWSTTAGVGFKVKEHLDFAIAYRVLNLDLSKNDFAMNVLLHGPAIGISYNG